MKVRVTRKHLERAFARQECVDGHRCVFGIGSEIELNPFIPPFVQATYQNASSRTKGALKRFELLSLAARAELEPTPAARTAAVAGIHRTWLQKPAGQRCFPYVSVKDLHAVIASAAARIESLDRRDPRRKLYSRRGLQIRGCRIGSPGDWLNLSHAKLPYSLRFIGCVIEASLELDGCELATLELSGSVVRGLDATLLRANSSVRLRRTFARAPLDFGGARVGGYFDATDCLILPLEPMPARQSFASDRGALNLSQATIQNEVYLNRSRIWGGLSMKGAVFERSLFMHDAIVGAPVAILETLVGKSIAATGVAARLNSLAKDNPGPQERIDLERVDRLLEGAGWEDQLDELVHQDHLIAKRIHGNRANKLRNLECVVSYTDRWVDRILDRASGTRKKNDTVLYQLLVESRRARTSSIRADGLFVGGSLYAAKLNASGRVRLRYATINGGLHLQGSWLRCIDAIGDNLNYWDYIEGDPATKAKKLLDLRVETFKIVRKAEKPKDDHHALDLRETHIKGSVTLHAYTESRPDSVERVPVRARLNGSITARRAVINGDFYASMVHDVTPRAHQRLQPPKERFEGHKKAGIDATTYAEQKKKKDRARRSDEKYTFQLENATIDGEVSFIGSLRIHGVNLLNATVNGDVSFSRRYVLLTNRSDRGEGEDPALKLGQSPVVSIPGRARNVRYVIDLRSATIEGDAYLPFYSPTLVRARAAADGVPPDQEPDGDDHGVVIKAEEVTVKGRLDIYPGLAVRSRRPGDDAPVRADNESLESDQEYFDLAAYQRACKSAADTRKAIEKVDWKELRDPLKVKRAWRLPMHYIDLRGSRSSAFCHLPNAWPAQGGLTIAGFIYDRTSHYGPLASFPSERRDTSAGIELERGLWLLVSLATAAGAIWVAWTYQFTLRWEAYALIGMVLACLLLQWWTRWREYYKNFSEPMALQWLRLQMHGVNRHTLGFRSFRPLDPYVQAAKALREDGRYQSANRVEEERLRVRLHYLSSPRHPIAKPAVWAVKATTGFGFKVERAAVVVLAMVLAFSLLSQAAYNTGHLCRDPEWRAPFSGFFYAMDLVIPVVDLGEVEHWQACHQGVSQFGASEANVKVARQAEINRAATAEAGISVEWLKYLGVSGDLPGHRIFGARLDDWFGRFFQYWKFLAVISGAVIVAVLAAAIATRAASAVARVRE